MKAMHIPSRESGKVLGYHQGKKAHLVLLPNGQQQLWSKSNTLVEVGEMTNKILMKIKGSKWDTIERIFDTVEEAAEYLAEITRFDPIKSHCSKGMEAELTNKWTISCNYDIRAILKKAPPKEELWDWYPFDMHRKIKRAKPIEQQPDLTPQKKQHTGSMIKLQDLTKDSRNARVILRDLVRQKKITKPGRWEWPENSPELEIVKVALKKTA